MWQIKINQIQMEKGNFHTLLNSSPPLLSQATGVPSCERQPSPRSARTLQLINMFAVPCCVPPAADFSKRHLEGITGAFVEQCFELLLRLPPAKPELGVTQCFCGAASDIHRSFPSSTSACANTVCSPPFLSRREQVLPRDLRRANPDGKILRC